MSYEPYTLGQKLQELYCMERRIMGNGDESHVPSLDAIVSVPRVDHRRCEGEKYSHANLSRYIVRIDGPHGKTVKAFVIDQYAGSLQTWTLASGGSLQTPLRKLLEPQYLETTLQLYRLCELLDAVVSPDERRFQQVLPHDARCIARALHAPEGFGHPAFTADLGQRLLARWRTAPRIETAGYLPTGEPDEWYALIQCHKPYTDVAYFQRNELDWIPDPEQDATLVWTVGRAAKRKEPDFHWSIDYDLERQSHPDEDAIQVVFENGGFGRARVAHKSLYANCHPWASVGDTLIPLTKEEAMEIQTYVVRPFTDTFAVMREVATGWIPD